MREATSTALRSHRRLIFLCLIIISAFMLWRTAAPVRGYAPPTELFFSEYIEGTSNNKALEIYNGTGAAINLGANGYNVQMYFNGSATAGLTINLTGTVAAGDVFVLAQSSASAAILAQADQTNGAGWFNGDDAVVLRKGTTVIDVIGQIGFDPGTEWGTGLVSTADNTLQRKSTVCAGDSNGADVFNPATEWDGLATDSFGGLGAHTTNCSGGDQAPAVTTTIPANNATNVAANADLTINFTEPVNVAGAWFTINGSSSGAHTAVVSGGPTSFTLNPDLDFALGETVTVTVVASQATDQDADDPPDNPVSDFVFSFAIVPPATPLKAVHEIQGASHLSPLAAARVRTRGIVTAERSNGYWIQDPNPDADEATSEGLFVFTDSAPAVNVGDEVEVTGTVTEFRPGGASSGNLTITEITSPSTVVNSSGNALPPPVVIGAGGRVPPQAVIEDDASGNVETSGVFDPATDGIDFYESLEGMRVQVNDALVVGPRTSNGEIAVVGDNGAQASVLTARGGIVIRPGDFNPERIIVDDVIIATPSAVVGDRFPGAMIGVLDYSFGNFKLLATSLPALVPGNLARESTAPAGVNQISIASFNVQNLDPNDPASRFNELAALIINNLAAPDILAVEEIQDNSGATNNSVVAADLTFSTLIAAISNAGGPAYDYRQIDPVNNQDGGEPGGNIRVGYLFRTDRGLSFIDRPGGTATAATTIVAGPSGAELSLSPGRVDPTNPAFTSSRKPLAGEFEFNGHRLILVANHWVSRGGDQPLFGNNQPPVLSSQVQREAQATAVRNFVDAILAVDPDANVVVLGDLNEFQFFTPVDTLRNAGLNVLIDTLPPAERYTYNFEGNSQALDHILVSDSLYARPFEYDIVHFNSEYIVRASDHDPPVVRITLNDPPTVDAGGPYVVKEGGTVEVAATGNDPEGGALSFAWDLDNNGTFETPGQTAIFQGIDAPATHTIKVRVTDNGGLTAVASATVTVIYDFSGFFTPISDPPAVNRAKAGSAVPIKFSLRGDQGLDILAAGSPQSREADCDTWAPIGPAEQIDLPGQSGLRYDPRADQYILIWKTEKEWSGTCRQLIVQLKDGTVYRANFSFK
jgi:predicted extracellular nuclease